jgi:hypothetical protein
MRIDQCKFPHARARARMLRSTCIQLRGELEIRPPRENLLIVKSHEGNLGCVESCAAELWMLLLSICGRRPCRNAGCGFEKCKSACLAREVEIDLMLIASLITLL